MSKSRSSSLEQGEIGATPDFNVSPQIDLEMVSEMDLRLEKEKKRKRQDHDHFSAEESEDILKIKPPQAKSSNYDEDSYKRFRRSDERIEDKPKKKSQHENLERLARERKRLDNERHRQMDKIQRDREYERELARKEKSSRMEDDRRREERRDGRRTTKSSHSVEYRKPRKEAKEVRSMALRDATSQSPSPSPRQRKDERRYERKRRERRSPTEDVMDKLSVGDRRKEEKAEVEEMFSKNVQDVEHEKTEMEEMQEDKVEAVGKSGSSVEKTQDSPVFDRYHFVRSKFDVDEEEDEEKSSATQNTVESHGRSPSLERRVVSPNLEEEEIDVTKKLESPQNVVEEDIEDVKTPVLPEAVQSEDECELPAYYPALQGCRSVEEFHCLNRINEGTYGVVFRALDLKLREIVALKRLKLEKEKDGFPITSLREIKLLMLARHPNVVTIKEVVVGSNLDKVYVVMEYVEHDMKSLMESMKDPFTIGEVKTLMIQLLRGVQHLHDNWIIHRDLKTSNLLLSHSGILKIADFGLAREYGSPLKPYTPVVVTLWYRAPELLLGTKMYSTTVDMWSVGCIFAEFLLRKPLFVGKTEIDQLNRIFKILGSPSESIWPGVVDLPMMQKNTFTQHAYNQLRKKFEPCLLSEKGFQMMNNLLTYCPEKRMTAESALTHDYFNETPLPTHPSMFPTWPAKSELFKAMKSPKAPAGGKAIPKLNNDKDLTKRNMPSQGFFFKFY